MSGPRQDRAICRAFARVPGVPASQAIHGESGYVSNYEPLLGILDDAGLSISAVQDGTLILEDIRLS